MKNQISGSEVPPRAVLYLRVSSGAQAVRDLSIPDQRKQLDAYCRQRGWPVICEYAETGSAFQGHRRKFDEMLEHSEQSVRPFERIIVHSFSRFGRDEIESELTIRQLNKRGIEVVGITQDIENSEVGNFIRRVIMLFDEQSSRETSKHVTRSLRENAKQGFWCGGPPPFGFRTYVSETRGETVKKKLEVNPLEAEVVVKMFDLLENGDGQLGPMGVKSITAWLNENGYRTRRGSSWTIGVVHRLLTDSAMKGDYLYGKKAGIETAVPVVVPEIIPAHRFDMAQKTLRERNPIKTPPRDTTSDILLSKVARCGHCGSGMTISTGKGGKYRYYSCSGEMRKGKSTCPGMRVPMDAFDQLVIEHISEALFSVERMREMLADLMERQAARRHQSSGHLDRIRAELDGAETRLRRFYDAIETGAIDPLEPTFKERLDDLTEKRNFAKAAEERALAELEPQTKLTNKMVEKFAYLVRTQLQKGSIQFKRRYLRAVIDTIIVNDDNVKIIGKSATGNRGENAAFNSSRQAA
jgi:DNA invertase Pin-like site-specific DNA recombinase